MSRNLGRCVDISSQVRQYNDLWRPSLLGRLFYSGREELRHSARTCLLKTTLKITIV